ncbi:hypothetical protein STCU_04265 [Strigomonas culicis]|uniref:Uncharacterized protein n=1 Tax=Strigomonas culicis TaxID=28005 RepID=S9UGW4_9TRYP|nr:hypothetical protein STCU_05502 [Strigomonas culicis]EPY30042.1 hypothetical protein STCU_04265 [Strigomonas culicis]|eukprot:EPY27836.1 hypothetical protein STCU_05502 [Strigomonas culicis]
MANLSTCELFTAHTHRVQSADFLQQFTGEKLYLDGLQIRFSGREIADPTRLEKLSIIDCKEVDFIDLENYTSLRTLLLSRTSIDSLEGVSKCKQLQLLNIGGCHLLKDVNCLHMLTGLKELFLHETGVTNAGILGLASCVNLEKLNLGGCLYLSDVNCLGALVNLKELHLWSTKINNLGIIAINGCESLVEVVLDDCPKVTDVSCLKDLYNLQFLSLIQTSVDEKGIKELKSCPLLECLGISGTQIIHPPKLWNHASVLQYLSSL